MKLHDLKTWPVAFQPMWDNLKDFEYRLNDRGYHVGDFLLIREYDPDTEEYTGRVIFFVIKYVLLGGVFGIPDDYCIMSLRRLKSEGHYVL